MENYNNTIANIFKLPIEYIKHNTIDNHILDDLELNGENNIIKKFHISNNNFLIDKLTKYYCTDTKYLKHFQKFMKKYKTLPLLNSNFKEEWVEFINETSFKQKYSYVEWEHLAFCNTSSQLMQIISVCNLLSPAISLIVPILFLVFPFILLRFIHKVPITFSSYKAILFQNMKNNILGQFIQEFSSGGNYDKKMYVLMGVGFYFFTVYQNFLTCLKFYNNVTRVKKMLYLTKNHIGHFINIHDAVYSNMKKYSKFKKFSEESNFHLEILRDLYMQLDFIKTQHFTFIDLNNIGELLSLLYKLYDSTDYNKSLAYSFGYLEYISYIQDIHKHYGETFNYCKFTKLQTNTTFKNQYYLALIDKTPIKNNITLDTNYIITGPNASGKTTFLKTTLINIILCQQIGMGCFEEAILCPYDNIYCYLNIPDTSNRDSLFQAEARRCLDIMNSIKKKGGNSICIFDELYSGTNPEEATKSAYAYLNYICDLPVNFLLTTHYYELCNLETIRTNIKNIHMKSNYNNCNIEYTYKIANGVSKTKGGCEVLKQLNYPDEILTKLHI